MGALIILTTGAGVAMPVDGFCGQTAEVSQEQQHEHSPPVADGQHPDHPGGEAQGWHYMQDGLLLGNFNRQGIDRGETEFVAENWYMGMLTRALPRGVLSLTGMFSLEPLTIGKSGYAELFQAGETFDGRPLIDRQHPHDFFMQLAAAWRIPLTGKMGLTLAGGPVGEPALGPVAFIASSVSG